MKAAILSAALILSAVVAGAGTNSAAVVMAASLGKDATWRTGRDTYTVEKASGGWVHIRENGRITTTMYKTSTGYTVIDRDGHTSTVNVR